MTSALAGKQASQKTETALWRLVRPHVPLLLVALVGALAVGPGVFLWARSNSAAWGRALIGSLACMTVWMALASGILAACARGLLGTLLRGGAVADAALVALAVLWLQASADPEAGTMPSWLAVFKIYLIWVAMALLAIASVSLAATPGYRYSFAAAAGTLLLLLCATPFWTSGWIDRTQQTDLVAARAVQWNPFYGVTAAVNDPLQFIWHQDAPRMYDKITRIGTDVEAPAPRWYDSAWRLGCCFLLTVVVSGALGAIRAARRRVTPLPASPPEGV